MNAYCSHQWCELHDVGQDDPTHLENNWKFWEDE